MNLLNNIFVITIIFFTILWVVYYFFGRRKRKRVFIHKDELSWQEKSPEENESLIYSVFLIGDAGDPSLSHQEPSLKLLEAQLNQVGENSSIFFLGDNIYPKGLPLVEDPSFTLAEKKLLEQLKILKKFKGRVFFISGNHDWNKGRKGGFEAMMRQQNYIDQYFKREDVFLPRNGCPGPVEYSPNEFVTFIIINTQWWVHRGKKTSEPKCTTDKSEFTHTLKRLLEKNKKKRIIVVGHHPLYSHALHGGKFDLKHHLFPLTALNKKMYIPIPIAGSLYPIYRKYIGAKEDMSHPKYKSLRKTLLSSFHNYKGLIYAAGHDHNLQYIKKHNQHYIVSGAGCKVTYVKKGKGAIFTHAHKGYFRINFYNNGKVWIEAWEPIEDGSIGKLAFRKEITETFN